MSRFVLDTNIALAYIREHPLYNSIEADHNLSDPENAVIISVTTWAELISLEKQMGWKAKKKKLLQNLRNLIVIGISEFDHELHNAYATIDAFSQGKLAERPLTLSSRHMGKNDLWIAATANVAKAKLITSDNDFDHLHPHFIEVIKYPPMSRF